MTEDPRLDPEKAAVFDFRRHMPYARRSSSAVIGIFVAVMLMTFFVGWFFFAPPDQENPSGAPQAERPVQYPGNNYAQGTGRSAVYDFFYKVFGGIDDGLEENPHNLENVDHLDRHNINAGEIFDGAQDNPTLALDAYAEDIVSRSQARNEDEYRHSVHDIVGSDVMGIEGKKAGQVFDILINKETGLARAVIMREDRQRYDRDLKAIRFKRVLKQQADGDVYLTISEDTSENIPEFLYAEDQMDESSVSLRRLRDGQLLDFEGNVTGQVDAVIYQSAEVQNIYFTLRPAIARHGLSTFQLPFEDVQIVENRDGLDIQLTEQQTRALAESIFEKP